MTSSTSQTVSASGGSLEQSLRLPLLRLDRRDSAGGTADRTKPEEVGPTTCLSALLTARPPRRSRPAPPACAAVSTPSSLNINPIIAAIPLMVLVVFAACVGAYTYTQRRLWGYRISASDVHQLEALAAKPAPLANRVGVLEFRNLAVR